MRWIRSRAALDTVRGCQVRHAMPSVEIARNLHLSHQMRPFAPQSPDDRKLVLILLADDMTRRMGDVANICLSSLEIQRLVISAQEDRSGRLERSLAKIQ